LEIETYPVDDGEARRVSSFEASSTDEDIKVMMGVWVTGGDGPVSRYLGYGTIGNGHIRSPKRGKVIDAWGGTTAADACSWNEDMFEGGVFDFGLHFGG